MSSTDKKNAQVHIKLPREMRAALKARAEREGRTINNAVLRAIAAYLRRRPS